MKMCHLLYNPWQESILNVNPLPLEIVTISTTGIGGGGKDVEENKIKYFTMHRLKFEIIKTSDD